MASPDQAGLGRGGAADIDHAVAVEWPAIVDAHGDGASVARIGHLHQRAEGQGAVGGGHGVHVEPLAIGSAAAVEAAAVVRGDAAADGAGGGLFLDRRLERVEIDHAGLDPQLGGSASKRVKLASNWASVTASVSPAVVSTGVAAVAGVASAMASVSQRKLRGT